MCPDCWYKIYRDVEDGPIIDELLLQTCPKCLDDFIEMTDGKQAGKSIDELIREHYADAALHIISGRREVKV